jgi:rod shape-determining protein MreC
MRNFLILLRRLRLFFLFLFLQGFAIFLTVRQFRHQRTFLFEVTSGVTQPIASFQGRLGDYLSLSSEVELLRQENAKLHTQLLSRHLAIYPFGGQSDSIRFVQAYDFLPARIIQNNISTPQNYFTINVGSLHGVKQDMGVVSPEGVVGFVVQTSAHYSLCMSLLNSKSSLSVQLSKGKHIGTLSWPGKDPLHAMVLNVPSHAGVSLGDTIETSGHSSLFPEGIPVGEITGSKRDPVDGYYSLTIRFFVDYFSVRSVYVIHHLWAEELKQLYLNNQAI